MRVPGNSLEVCELTFDETREFCSSFHATEGRSSPRPSGEQLESRQRVRVSCKQPEVDGHYNSRTSGDLLSCSGDANDGRDSPPLMASLESSTHNVDLTPPVSASEK